MDTPLRRVRDRQAAVHEEMTALIAKAEGENRDLNEEETKVFDRLAAEKEQLGAREKRLQIIDDPTPSEPPTAMARLKGGVVDSNAALPRQTVEKPAFSSFGEQLAAIYRASAYFAGRDGGYLDPRLTRVAATGMQEGVNSEGGFLVQTDYEAGVMTRAYGQTKAWSRARNIPISSAANGVIITAIDESSRATGSRWGGVRGYWLEEGGTKTKSKPAFRQIVLKLKKLIGLAYATDELLADATALGAVMENGFADEFAFMLDDAVINGTGAGQPLGLLNAGCTVSQSKETGQAAATIVADNVFKMYARLWAPSLNNAVWFINQSCWPQLFALSQAVGVGGVPMFIPAGGINQAPAGTLLGRPIVPVEGCAALGTVGDIIFADMGQYVTATKGGIQSASSIHVQFTTDETTFRWVYRADGMPTWNAALTPYKDTAKTQSPFVTLATRA